MSGTDFKFNMMRLGTQIDINKAIAEPQLLPAGMHRFQMQARDLQLMRAVMNNTCAPELLRQIRDMRGSKQEYQAQKQMLIDNVFLNDMSAHRALVGLWALVGKDADEAAGVPTVSSPAAQTAKPVQPTQPARPAAPAAQPVQPTKPAVQPAASAPAQSVVWGHSALYYILMAFAEYNLIELFGGFASQYYWLGELYPSENDIKRLLLGVATIILMFVLDKKNTHRLGRLRTTIFSAGSILPKGEGPWTTYYVKLILWVATLALIWYFYFTQGSISSLTIVSILLTACTDAVFSAQVHQYLNSVQADPNTLKG